MQHGSFEPRSESSQTARIFKVRESSQSESSQTARLFKLQRFLSCETSESARDLKLREFSKCESPQSARILKTRETIQFKCEFSGGHTSTDSGSDLGLRPSG